MTHKGGPCCDKAKTQGQGANQRRAAHPCSLSVPSSSSGSWAPARPASPAASRGTCGVSSVDLDTFLERREGKRIKSIFAESGEAGFRAIETDVLAEIAGKDDPLLVSCGGGVVLREENRAILKSAGVVVHLRVSADEAASRISDKSSRPLFQDIEAARARCDERAPLRRGRGFYRGHRRAFGSLHRV